MEELKLQSVRKTEEERRLPGREDPAETSKGRREPRKGDGGWDRNKNKHAGQEGIYRCRNSRGVYEIDINSI